MFTSKMFAMVTRIFACSVRSLTFSLKIVGVFAALGLNISAFNNGVVGVHAYLHDFWFSSVAGAAVLSVTHFLATVFLPSTSDGPQS